MEMREYYLAYRRRIHEARIWSKMFESTQGTPSDFFAVRPQATLTIGVSSGDDEWTLSLDGRSYRLSGGRPEAADLRFSAGPEVWAEYAKALPRRGYTTVAGLHRCGALTVDGDLVLFYSRQLLIEEVFRQLHRIEQTDPPADPANEIGFEPISGRYVRMTIRGQMHRIYVEEAGAGIPMLCLHTAGSDSRQYRGLLNDPEITSHFRVIAFDLPWHGKSSPPAGFQKTAYSLNADNYTVTILALCDALQLDRPVVMGCSIGGRMVLELGLRCPQRFRAGIGLQSAPSAVKGEADSYRTLNVARRPDVNGPETAAARVRPVMSPSDPISETWETLWHYMQSGPGVFEGDTDYYFESGTLSDDDIGRLAAAKYPTFLLTGDYDMGVPPEATHDLAKRINARYCATMNGLGHFPMSENYTLFRRYLIPVLDQIRQLSDS